MLDFIGEGLFLRGIGGRRRGGFNPASLFAGASGLWLDRAGTGARFADAIGTTAATIGGGIGLRLDKSKGLVLGPEKVANGNFPDGSLAGWTAALGEQSASLGGIRVTGPGTSGARSVTTLTGMIPGMSSRLSLNIIENLASQAGWRVTTSPDGGPDGAVLGVISQAGTGERAPVFVASAATMYLAVLYTATAGKDSVVFDNISVRELPGNHGTQSTGTFAPKLRNSGAFLYDEYDGSDDRLQTSLLPTTAGTIAGYIRGTTASRVVAGSAAATDGRAFLALDASGRLGAGIGAQSTTTIFGGADIRNQWHACAVTWDGTTVRLYLDGEEIYSGAQSGAVNTTVPFRVGALNSNGTAGAFWGGDVADLIVLDEALPAATILKMSQKWSA